MSLQRLNRIRSVDVLNNTLIAEAGCLLQSVQEAAILADRLFPLSIASEGSATIGGNLSTNAGGVQVVRYGNTRDLVLGMEVVLADGQVWNGLRGLRKDNTGYDLKHLFIGAEGTLGLITAASLKLFHRPKIEVVAWVAVSTLAQVVELFGMVRDCLATNLNAFELIGESALALVVGHIPRARRPVGSFTPWHVLVEVAGADDIRNRLITVLNNAEHQNLIKDAIIAESDAQARELWALRENISEAQKREGISIKHDVSLPISAIGEFVERAGIELLRETPDSRVVCFGHVGDGNLHYNLSLHEPLANQGLAEATQRVNRVVHDIVHELNGSISAEHGIGQLKRDELSRYKASVEVSLMRSIKTAIDPLGLLNPGKVL